LTRKRKGLPINGWLIIDKPQGMTSTQVVGKVRYLTQAAKLGHGGTLDPMATGVLPIALGEATKTVGHAMDGSKTYRFTIRWGIATDTEDVEGQVTATALHRPDKAAIEAALPRFLGSISQMPPQYSALKIDGQRAYDLARAGKHAELVARDIVVHNLTLLGQPDADHAELEASVGKGTYIRSLGRDLAHALGTEGHLVALRRLSVGKFSIDHAISLETLAETMHGAGLDVHLHPVETALDDIPALALTEAEATRLQQGQALTRPDLAEESYMALASLANRPIALVEIEGTTIRPVRVFNL
jgi:tRNA pseudouridine55 synthase